MENTMRALIIPIAALLAVGSTEALSAHHKARQLLTFQMMYGVDGAFVGEANPIRGVNGDELPWAIKKASGSLDTEGNLVIFVRGLLFADDEIVPEEIRGTNDEEQFRGLVSCLVDEDGVIET